MISRHKEEIEWIDPDDEMPDDAMIVLVFIPDENDPVWLGHYDSNEGWCGVVGMPFDVPVIAWAEMPSGPPKREVEE